MATTLATNRRERYQIGCKDKRYSSTTAVLWSQVYVDDQLTRSGSMRNVNSHLNSYEQPITYIRRFACNLETVPVMSLL